MRERGGTSAPSVAVSVLGLRPAVVTEFLWGLCVARRPPVVPSRLFLLTTGPGAEVARRTLLGRRGALARLRREHRLPSNAFRCGPSDVHVLDDENGRPLEDLRTSAQSERAGDAIGRIVERLCADGAPPVHASIAGGRKTMGALLALALLLHGRPEDRLYHVLVDPDLEQDPDFFFPPREPHRARKGADPGIDLAQVPFPALGSFVRSLGIEADGLAATARRLTELLADPMEPPPLLVDLTARRARVGASEVDLPPQSLLLLALYGTLRRGCASCRRPEEHCPGCFPTDTEIVTKHRGLLRRLAHLSPSSRLQAAASAVTLSTSELQFLQGWLRQGRSRLRRQLASRAIPRLASVFVELRPQRDGDGEARRGLPIPPDRIEIRGVADSTTTLPAGEGAAPGPGWREASPRRPPPRAGGRGDPPGGPR